MDVECKLPMVSIPLAEYEDLLRESEKVECLKRYIVSADDVLLDTIFSILDYKKGPEEIPYGC